MPTLKFDISYEDHKGLVETAGELGISVKGLYDKIIGDYIGHYYKMLFEPTEGPVIRTEEQQIAHDELVEEICEEFGLTDEDVQKAKAYTAEIKTRNVRTKLEEKIIQFPGNQRATSDS